MGWLLCTGQSARRAVFAVTNTVFISYILCYSIWFTCNWCDSINIIMNTTSWRRITDTLQLAYTPTQAHQFDSHFPGEASCPLIYMFQACAATKNKCIFYILHYATEPSLMPPMTSYICLQIEPIILITKPIQKHGDKVKKITAYLIKNH